MDKKFEKKTEFGFFGACLDEVIEHYERNPLGFSFNNNTVGEMAQHIIDSHAEIDRLTDELASLRSQSPERKRTNREENKVFPEAGVWFYQNLHGVRGVEIVESDKNLVEGFDYTLILPLKDFPKPPEPKPLEVKVGKYRELEGTITEVLSIVRGHVMYLVGDESFTNTVNDFTSILNDSGATFIEEAADVE